MAATGAATGGGILLALSSFRSRSKTDFALICKGVRMAFCSSVCAAETYNLCLEVIDGAVEVYSGRLKPCVERRAWGSLAASRVLAAVFNAFRYLNDLGGSLVFGFKWVQPGSISVQMARLTTSLIAF